MEPRAAAARELLLAALEDLSQEQLKRFRHKLRDAPMDGRSIPWGRLERADAMDLAEQLTHFYGPEPALDVARKTLKRADVRDVAARLKAQRQQRELWLGVPQGPWFRVFAARCLPSSFPYKTLALYPQICKSYDSDPGCSRGRPRPPIASRTRRSLTSGFRFRARPQLLGAALRGR